MIYGILMILLGEYIACIAVCVVAVIYRDGKNASGKEAIQISLTAFVALIILDIIVALVITGLTKIIPLPF